MIQSRKFQQSDIANIRSRYTAHPLFVAIDKACYRWEEKMQYLMLSPAEIFWHTANGLDYIREQQQDALSEIERLATQYYNDWHRTYPAAEKEERALAVTLMIISLANCLYLDGHYLYKKFADTLIRSLKDKKHTEAYEASLDAYAAYEADITRWMQDYMPSDEWLFDEINQCLTPTDIDSSEHFAYLIDELSEQAIRTFESQLRTACTGTATDVAYFILDNAYTFVDIQRWRMARRQDKFNELKRFGLQGSVSNFGKAWRKTDNNSRSRIFPPIPAKT